MLFLPKNMATAMNARKAYYKKQYIIYFALAKTNNTQIKLKEEQKEAVCQIVNGRDVKSLIYQVLPSMFDYIKGPRPYSCCHA